MEVTDAIIAQEDKYEPRFEEEKRVHINLKFSLYLDFYLVIVLNIAFDFLMFLHIYHCYIYVPPLEF